MKKLLLLLLLVSSHCFSQSEIPFNYLEEVNRMGNTPNSPGAQAFAQYGNIPVNLLVGAPDISIPLYTYKGREMNLPISLTYDINNRKVEDIASGIGLGWNLNLGGRVSRIVNGLPDDYFSLLGGYYQTLFDLPTRDKYNDYKDYFFDHTVHEEIPPNINFFDEDEALDYFRFLYDIDRGAIDISSDNFSINALGVSEHIVLEDENLDAIPQNNPRLEITYLRGGNFNSIISWEVLDEFGTQYFFEQQEPTSKQNFNDNGETYTYWVDYNSSWLLTKIISPNEKDTYEFEYESEGLWLEPVFVRSMHAINYGNDPQRHDYELGDKYSIDQQFLKQVKHNGKVIVLINKGDREDLDIDNSAIESITIKSPIDGSTVNHFQFTQTYFGTVDEGNIEEIRLKLDAIEIAGSDYNGSGSYNFKKKYSFVYDREEQMPTRKTFAQDILGFYNGQIDNDALEGTVQNPWGLLIPRIVIENNTGPDTVFEGANRDFSEEDSKIGILTEIHYPTGGHNLFEFEANKESHYEDVTQTYFSFSQFAESDSGVFDSTQCGSCCMDSQPNGEPKNAEQHSIELPQTDSYSIEFITSSDTGNDKRAYLLGPFANNDYSYTYEDICLGNVSVLHEYSGDSVEDDLNLVEGSYQVILYNGDQDNFNCGNNGTCTRVTFKIRGVEVTGQELVTTDYPGLRVKSISSFTDENEISTKKTFSYSGFSKNYEPKLYYLISESGFEHHRLTKAIMGSQPYITYGAVEETNVSPLSGQAYNGKIVHEFYNDPLDLKGIVPQILPPFATDYYGNVEKGNSKKQSIYNNDQELLSTSQNLYVGEAGDIMKGSIIQDAPLNRMKFIKLKEQGGYVRFSFVEGDINNLGDLVPPNSCNVYPNIGCLQSNANSRLKPIYTYSRPKNLIEQESTSTQYFNGVSTSQTTNVIFDPGLDYLPSESRTTTSKDDKVILTKYSDYNDEFSIPELVENYQKIGDDPEELLSTKKIIYNTFYGMDLPRSIQTSKRDEDLETRITYDYNSFGNPVDATQGGAHTSYIWGYNGQYPVAKLANKSYALIPGNLITAIHDASDEINYSESDLFDALDALRSTLPDTQIISYTYLPSIGVSTITDARGDRVTFNYDDLNRLEYVIDKDGNRVSENQYNYKNQ